MLKAGDRAVVVFTIRCSECNQYRRGYFSLRERGVRDRSPFGMMIRTDLRIRTGRTLDRWTDDVIDRTGGQERPPPDRPLSGGGLPRPARRSASASAPPPDEPVSRPCGRVALRTSRALAPPERPAPERC